MQTGSLVGGLVGWALIPTFVAAGWLKAGEPFRKITFLIALGTNGFTSAILVLVVVLPDAAHRFLVGPRTEPRQARNDVHDLQFISRAHYPASIPGTDHLLAGADPRRLAIRLNAGAVKTVAKKHF